MGDGHLSRGRAADRKAVGIAGWRPPTRSGLCWLVADPSGARLRASLRRATTRIPAIHRLFRRTRDDFRDNSDGRHPTRDCGRTWVTSRILTGVIGVAVVMLPYLVMAGSYAVYEAVGWNESMYLLVLLLALGVNIGYLAWILVLLFSRGQTVGQRLVGLYTRDAITREKATGKLFVKLLLQGAIASVTAGIVEPLVSLLSHRDGQTWFDTTCGTMVYKAASLSSFDAARHPVVVPAKPAIAMVSLDGLPVDHAPVGQRGSHVPRPSTPSPRHSAPRAACAAGVARFGPAASRLA